MKLVVDSSVIVSAIRPDERFHGESLDFLERVQDQGDEVWVPMTVLWEIGAAVSHPGKTPMGTKFNKTFSEDLKLIPIDEGLFQRSWKGGICAPVKAADRIFLSCAIDQGALLVSWDENLVRNASSFGVSAKKPSEYP